jgi:hypothetical protein
MHKLRSTLDFTQCSEKYQQIITLEFMIFWTLISNRFTKIRTILYSAANESRFTFSKLSAEHSSPAFNQIVEKFKRLAELYPDAKDFLERPINRIPDHEDQIVFQFISAQFLAQELCSDPGKIELVTCFYQTTYPKKFDLIKQIVDYPINIQGDLNSEKQKPEVLEWSKDEIILANELNKGMKVWTISEPELWTINKIKKYEKNVEVSYECNRGMRSEVMNNQKVFAFESYIT